MKQDEFYSRSRPGLQHLLCPQGLVLGGLAKQLDWFCEPLKDHAGEFTEKLTIVVTKSNKTNLIVGVCEKSNNQGKQVDRHLQKMSK